MKRVLFTVSIIILIVSMLLMIDWILFWNAHHSAMNDQGAGQSVGESFDRHLNGNARVLSMIIPLLLAGAIIVFERVKTRARIPLMTAGILVGALYLFQLM